MSRPWIIWLLSLFCAAAIFSAMGVITHRSLRMEQEGAQARAEAELQERLRLSLWRMETEAAALMIEENIRPPEQLGLQPGGPPSPLAGYLPRNILLHFDIGPDGRVTSPQVPQSGSAPVQGAPQHLARLQSLLARTPSSFWRSSVVQTAEDNASGKAKAANSSWAGAVFLDAASQSKGPFEEMPQALSKDALRRAPSDADAPQQEGASKVAQAEKFKQAQSNVAELAQRGKIYANTNTSSAKPMEKIAPLPEVAKKADLKAAKPTAVASAAPTPRRAAGAGVEAPVELAAAPSLAPAAPPPAAAPAQEADAATARQASATPYRPFWLENELFLVREVYAAGKRHVQGVWLDSSSLKASLLDAIADLLPHASLQAVANVAFVPTAAGQLSSMPAFSSGDPMDLVGLPWKLIPGEKAVAVVAGWTPMRLTLTAAWVGALLAAAAAAALLFGVARLSERRAAFVSSVTHELRTPLTTFRLYSELLEQGMVRDEAVRNQYLHTLRSEADRLTHLVDNVLAYSRIERTNRRSRMDRLELAPWIDRVKPRLEDRAREAGMALDIAIAPDSVGVACVTDATALEQIIFNLVDNACKYAAGRCSDPVVRLVLEQHGKWVHLKVCDSGPGIAREEHARLFRPFHKSADEAANSKPGVGLGLALCHRLAGALGGKLSLEKPAPQAQGACFVLTLPAA